MPGRMDKVYQNFAQLLDYPVSSLSHVAQECAGLVEPYSIQAASLLTQFANFSQAAAPGCLEEAYTYAFDLQAAFQPYVGYHLFGDTYQRSLFLLGLSERYRQHGFITGKELPDHLSVILRFLARCPDPVMKSELILEALLPALQRMVHPQAKDENEEIETNFDREHDAGQNVYRSLLKALTILLQEGL